MRVICHDERKPRFACQPQKPLIDLCFLRKLLILKLQIEISRPEDLAVFQRRLLCRRIVVLMEILRNAARETGRQADQSLVMLAKQLHIHARTIIKAVDEAARDKVCQVLIAGHVLTQQDQVIRLAVERVDLVKARARRDIDLAADDRLDVRCLCRPVEVDHAVHHAVVRDGDSVLPELFDARHDILDAARPVEQAVFRMDMQMDKTHDSASLKLL